MLIIYFLRSLILRTFTRFISCIGRLSKSHRNNVCVWYVHKYSLTGFRNVRIFYQTNGRLFVGELSQHPAPKHPFSLVVSSWTDGPNLLGFGSREYRVQTPKRSLSRKKGWTSDGRRRCESSPADESGSFQLSVSDAMLMMWITIPRSLSNQI